jgi:hypothetical protein
MTNIPRLLQSAKINLEWLEKRISENNDTEAYKITQLIIRNMETIQKGLDV